MKIGLIPALAWALVALASTCVAYTPTSEDMAWRTVAINDSAVINSDASLVANAISGIDSPAVKKYSDLLEEDAGKARLKSQAFTVSPELLNAKNYYEKSLSSFQIGAQKISQACSVYNPTVMKEGLDYIRKGSEYMVRAAREMNITFAG
jgi:hypothetical protein